MGNSKSKRRLDSTIIKDGDSKAIVTPKEIITSQVTTDSDSTPTLDLSQVITNCICPNYIDHNRNDRANYIKEINIPVPKSPTKDATEHLSKEIQRIIQMDPKKHGFTVEPIDDNLFKWEVHLLFDETSQIRKDLESYALATGHDDVKLEVAFPFHYPQAPPFIRVVYPRFHQYTGHITLGGSICVKGNSLDIISPNFADLTMSGWNSSNELTSFLIMIRNLLLEGNALINMDNLTEYSEAEAKQAFNRVAKAHGWLM